MFTFTLEQSDKDKIDLWLSLIVEPELKKIQKPDYVDELYPRLQYVITPTGIADSLVVVETITGLEYWDLNDYSTW